MKLAIFGATGKIGQHVVAQALKQEHVVTAFVRSPDKLKIPCENLVRIKGDMLDRDTVKRAIEGQDAVVCTLGMPLMNGDHLREKGTKNIVRAMQSTGVKRLICLSMLGVGDSYNLLPFHYKFLIIPLVLGRVAKDHGRQEEIIRNSGLDWIIARPGNFSDAPPTGSYYHGFSAINKSMSLKIPRADVAEFLLKQLNDNTYLHQTPGISG